MVTQYGSRRAHGSIGSANAKSPNPTPTITLTLTITLCRGMAKIGQTKLSWFAAVTHLRIIQGGPPKMAQFLYALTLPNINRFSKLVHCHIRRKFVTGLILSLEIPSHHTSSVSLRTSLPCEMSVY